jgi:hypothetical protein
MLAAIKAGEADVIVAYSASRITRRLSDWQDLITLVEATGCRVETVVSGAVDVNTADGRLVLNMLASVDQAEAERTAERITRAHRQRVDAGRAHWPRRPFGHEKDGTVHAVEAAAIVDAAERILNSGTLADIVRRWAEQGLTTITGAPWTTKTIGDMLRSARLAGIATYRGKETGRGAWDAVLPEVTWRAMVATLDARVRDKPRPTGRLVTMLGGGLATCSACGGKVTRVRREGRWQYVCAPRGCVAVDMAAVDQEVFLRAVLASAMWGAHVLPAEAAPDLSPMLAEERGLIATVAALEADLEAEYSPALARVLRAKEASLAGVRKALAESVARTVLPQDVPQVIEEWQTKTLGEQRAMLARVYATIRLARREEGQEHDGDRVVTRFAEGWLPADAMTGDVCAVRVGVGVEDGGTLALWRAA